jgi:uncharacterized SAM-binding protein YcdF (DUF218 family)
MKSRIIIFCTLFIIVIVFIVNCRKAGEWLVEEDEPVQADAIVILMGSVYDRVLHAVDLFQQGWSTKMIIVETRRVHDDKVIRGEAKYNKSNTGQTRNIAISLGIPADSIITLWGGARSTQKEAIIIRHYLANKPEIDTILLVSSAEHTRRASIIFKFAFKQAGMPVHVVSCPSGYSDFNAEKWWTSGATIIDVFMEYIKLANFVFIQRRKL